MSPREKSDKPFIQTDLGRSGERGVGRTLRLFGKYQRKMHVERKCERKSRFMVQTNDCRKQGGRDDVARTAVIAWRLGRRRRHFLTMIAVPVRHGVLVLEVGHLHGRRLIVADAHNRGCGVPLQGEPHHQENQDQLAQQRLHVFLSVESAVN